MCREMISVTRARSAQTIAAPIATEVKGLSEETIRARGKRSRSIVPTSGSRLDPPTR